MKLELGALIGAFAIGTLLGELFGAANLGTSMTFGVLAFTATLIWVILKRP